MCDLTKKRGALIAMLIGIGCAALFVRLFLGIFVIQPIGAIPDGATIVYWRNGLNVPFVASADGLVVESGAQLSLLTRGMMLSTLAEPIRSREIVRFRYSRPMYLLSTGGKEYDR